MTYDQFRAALSLVAKYGDAGAPHDLLPPGRWMDLRNSRVVVQEGACWVITHQGWRVLEEPTRPRERPDDRPVQRKASREMREVRELREVRQARSA